MEKLSFPRSHKYNYEVRGIPVPATLRDGPSTVELSAVLDTGCWACVFERRLGEALGVDIEGGEVKTFVTANGTIETFGHRVEIETLGVKLETTVYFFADPRINKNLLGRTGWLDRVRLAIVDYDQTLYLAPYDLEA